MKRIIWSNVLGVLVACSALDCLLSTTFAQVVTFTNPTPATEEYFGYSVAAVGTDRVLIGAHQDSTGAPWAGAAYLFSTNGALLTTFTNPTPANDDRFGYSVAAVGTDRVLIGAYLDDTSRWEAGVAYLFNTNGALLTIFTNPIPADYAYFGFSVAALGSDRVLIGAVGDNTGVSAAGAAYLFSTNGALQVTFTNPTPAVHDEFGWCVVAVGTDRVLIAAPGDDTGATDVGAAYLFRANGTLLTIFTNPAPNSTPTPLVSFGSSVAVVGTDQVLIGSPWNNTGANHTGAAYLFSTNGTLLTTFTNPAPAAYDNFGRSVAALGSDQVLIAASFDDIGAKDAGAAYLFSTNGTLLKTFSKPTPAASDGFGSAVAALGTNCVLIAALGDDTGATNSGAVYLFSVAVQTAGAPVLTICLTTTNTVAVSWPSPSTDWTLQENTNGVVSVNWSNRTSSILDDGTNKVLIIGPPTGDRFYRLFKP